MGDPIDFDPIDFGDFGEDEDNGKARRETFPFLATR